MRAWPGHSWLQELKIKWWEKERGGGSCKAEGGGSSSQLSLANLGGVFIVLVGGMFISVIIAVFEFSWKRRKLLVDENVSFPPHSELLHVVAM